MEILGMLLLIFLGGISIIALLATVNLLIPVFIEKTCLNLESSPGRSLLLGLVNFIFFMALAGLFGWLAQATGPVLNSIFTLLVGLIALGLTLFTLLGLTAFAKLLGERMGGGETPFIANLRGGILFLLAGLSPYVGWFLFTPLIIWAGFGAALYAFIRRPEKASTIKEAS